MADHARHELLTDATHLLSTADHEAQRAEEEWLTVKEFAAKVNWSEHSVREAIRKRRLTYRVERLSNGPKGAIRIVVPKRAA